MKRILFVFMIIITIFILSCEAQKSEDKAFVKERKAETPLVKTPMTKEGIREFPPIKEYSPKSKKDPFKSLIVREDKTTKEGLKGLSISELKLVGIIWGREFPLALVETQDGLGYILKKGDVVRDGKVVEISKDTIILQISDKYPSVEERGKKIVLVLPKD